MGNPGPASPVAIKSKPIPADPNAFITAVAQLQVIALYVAPEYEFIVRTIAASWAGMMPPISSSPNGAACRWRRSTGICERQRQHCRSNCLAPEGGDRPVIQGQAENQ